MLALSRLAPTPPRPDLMIAALREGAVVLDLVLAPAAAEPARRALIDLMAVLRAHARRPLRLAADAEPATADETAIAGLVGSSGAAADARAALVAAWLVRPEGQAALLDAAARLARALGCGRLGEATGSPTPRGASRPLRAARSCSRGRPD